MNNNYKDIEDYGVIGNLKTCALVAKDGSIDWLCLPELANPSAFAALLDSERGGSFSIKPASASEALQSYVGSTNVLQTNFVTSLGEVAVTDFMEVHSGSSDYVTAVYRKLEGLKGNVQIEVDFSPRFEYATALGELAQTQGGVVAKTDGKSLFLQSPVSLSLAEGCASATVSVKKGDVLWFSLQYNAVKSLKSEECETLLNKVKEYWAGWAHRSKNSSIALKGEWHNIFVRSGLILKLLVNPETGAIAAAATTSLPEQVGGVRNWDYRYTWIRDASFTTQALFHLGHVEEAKNFRKWLEAVVKHEDPSEIQIMYGLHGEKNLEERTLDNLSGYKNSSPVRIGNAAFKQKQLDIYGELVCGICETTRYGEDVSDETWSFVKSIVDYVCKVWNTTDSGIWEVRGGAQHFVYSKLMCWVALDRGVKLAKMKPLEPERKEKWEQARDEVKNAILEKGFSKKLNSFVQSFGSETLDATNLLISVLGLLSPDDPRVLGTIDATLKQLSTPDGMVYRYKSEDGLPGGEGHFLLCSFWLVKALSLSGRIDEAERVFRSALAHISPLGLYSEEIDSKTNKQIGNFPQAFSHLGLVNAALYLGITKGKKHIGPRPMGML